MQSRRASVPRRTIAAFAARFTAKAIPHTVQWALWRLNQGGIEREARQEGHRKNDDVEREDSEDRRSRTKLGQQRIDDRSESGLSKVRDRAGAIITKTEIRADSLDSSWRLDLRDASVQKTGSKTAAKSLNATIAKRMIWFANW